MGSSVPETAAGRTGPRLLWWYIPTESLLHSSSFRAMIFMRVAAETAVNALSYGMLIQIVTQYENNPRAVGILSSLVTIATVAPAALFGPLGGVVVDRAPKRMMLVLANLARALLCLGLLFIGTETVAIYGLLVAITIATQFATPAESAIVPRVVPHDRLAAANSFGNFAESAGALLGTAILAPILVKLPGSPGSIILVSGMLLTYAAVRAVAIRLTVPEVIETKEPPLSEPESEADEVEKKPWLVGTREALIEAWQWLAGDRAAFISMMLLVLASTANLVMVTLFPRYAKQALGVAPELAVFVFGPAVVGVILGLVLTPKLAERIEKRLLVTIGFLLMVSLLLLFGAINGFTSFLRALPVGKVFEDGPLGYQDGRLGAALVLAAPLGFGLSMVQVAAQTLLHERVPLEMQGRVFALQGAVKNATAILPLLVLGGLASVLGDVRPVLIIAALLLLSLALYGGARSAQWTGGGGPNPPTPFPEGKGEPRSGMAPSAESSSL